jgi:WD40 repeat protein/O-acetyl-ADP-ribose deacetylase (regulator of RNase III)
MGKSSLRVQMTKKLKAQGVKCATIDMTRIGSHVTPEEWYGGLVSELLRGFRLSRKINFSNWWRDRSVLSPVQRLSEFIDDVLLIELSQNIVIFIDEIDSIIKIPFRDDFFAFIRACYNQRVDNPDYQRLTFCLLGVATPSDLIADRTLSTPFNIGTAIELTGFHLHEVNPLVQGLESIVSNPNQVIADILEWTGGQPFLTQKLCKLIVQESESDRIKLSNGIEALVLENIIENWEACDEPEHLRTIRDRIKWSQRQKPLLLLYQKILQQGAVKAKDTPEQMELRLSGLVVKQQGKLRVANRILRAVFNNNWVNEILDEANLPQRETPLPIQSPIEVQELDQIAASALQLFALQEIKALLSAMKAGQALYCLVNDNRPLQDYPTVRPILALQTILDNIQERNQFKAHQYGVNNISFSSDRQNLVTAGIDGTVLLWSQSGQQIAQLERPQRGVRSVSFSPDNQHIATAGEDGKVRLWHLSGQQIAEFDTHQVGIICVNFSPNGEYLAMAGDSFVKIWNLSGQLLAQCERTTSEKSSLIGVGLQINRDIKVLKIGQPMKNSPAHQAGLRAGDRILAIDGQPISTMNLQEALTLLSGNEGTQVSLRISRPGCKNFNVSITRVQIQLPVTWLNVSFSANGQRIAAVNENGMIKVWDLSGRQLAQWKGEAGITSFNFSPDGQKVATVNENGMIKLWDLSGRQLAQWKGETGITNLSFSPDGQCLATTEEDGITRLWNLSGEPLYRLHSHQGSVSSLCFSPNRQLMATGGTDETVKIWDLSQKHSTRWNTDHGRVYVVSFTPSKKYIFTVGADCKIRLWNLKRKQLAQLDDPQGWIKNASFSPGMHYLVAAGADGKVRLWRVISQPINTPLFNSLLSSNPDNPQWQLKNLEGVDYNVIFCYEFPDSARVNSVSCSPGWQTLSTKCIATTGTDGIIGLWDVSGTMLNQWNTNRGELKSISFHPDGQRIATAGIDGTVCLWDLSGHNLGEWKAHQGEATSISCSPNGQIIATAGADDKAKLWTISGQLLAEFQGHQGAIRTVSFCESGKRIATAGYDGIVRLWWVERLEDLLARGYDWLKDYLVIHPEALKTLKHQFNSISAESKRLIPPSPSTTPATPNPLNSELKINSSSDASATSLEPQQRLVKIVAPKPGEGFLSEFLVADKLVRIYQGDITNLAADVIVSSDDTYLSMRGGVSRGIRRIGGEEIYRESQNFRISNALSIGDVVVTSAGNLPAKKIFHGTVIDWQLELFPSKNIIQKVVHDCLIKANKYGYKTIVFPLLGTGAGCLDKQIALEMMLKQITMDLSTIHQTILEVLITLYGRETVSYLNWDLFIEMQAKWGIKLIKLK